MFERHCYKACPEKTFGVKWECRACGTNCGSCDQHECYWCEEGFFLSGGSCVQDCGPGFHGDQELGECKPCHRACENCTGSGYNQCSSCQEGLQLWHGTCLWSTWPQVEGKDWNEAVPTEKPSLVRSLLQDRRKWKVQIKRDATSQNQPCHSSCKTCNGSLCASCPTGMYLWLQACVPSCPQGTWPSVTSGSCEKCSEDCVSCSGADLCQQCLSQPDNTLLLHEGRCYHSCPEGFYAKDGVCEHCSSPCKTCEGNATSCNSCEGDFVLDHGVCWKTCPEKHVAVEGVCKHCPERCQDCIHEKTCKECMPDFFLYNDMCHRSCPKSFYPDMRQCVPCHKNCLECNGPKEDDCKVCADTSKALHNGLCLDECPEGTYKEEENDECRDCPESCLICSSAWTCLACREGFTVVHDVCTAPKECAAVEYWDEGSHRCQPCHKKCSRCSGPSEDQCYTCPRETFLLNTTCVKECPEGYHTDKDSQQCVLCHSSCRTCEGPHSMQCLSCRPGWFQLGKECLLQCRDGYYGESTSGRCEKCDKSCKSCRGPRPTDCQSCDTFFFLLRSKGQCHRACPEHYYADQHAQTCERCHPTCDKCSGKEAWSCLSCVWSYHLLKGICIPECIVGEYREGKGENFNCKKCHESCMECKGPGSKNCTGCSAGLLLDMDDNRCLHCCNASHSRRSQDCCDCQSSTDECILPAREAEFYEHTKTALLVTSGAMLLLLLGAAAVVWRKSRSRPVAKGRYEKLAEPTVSYSSYRSSYLDEDQVIEYRDRDYDEDDEDDIVYMGQDGTVYRKFKYGLLDETEDDELEYDDESYSYQ